MDNHDPDPDPRQCEKTNQDPYEKDAVPQHWPSVMGPDTAISSIFYKNFIGPFLEDRADFGLGNQWRVFAGIWPYL